MFLRKFVALSVVFSLLFAEPMRVLSDPRQDCLDDCASEYTMDVSSCIDTYNNDLAAAKANADIEDEECELAMLVCIAAVSGRFLVCVALCNIILPCHALCAVLYAAETALCGTLLAGCYHYSNTHYLVEIQRLNTELNNCLGDAAARRALCEAGCPPGGG